MTASQNNASCSNNTFFFFLLLLFLCYSANKMQKQVEVRMDESHLEPSVEESACSSFCDKIMKNMVLTLTILGRFQVLSSHVHKIPATSHTAQLDSPVICKSAFKERLFVHDHLLCITTCELCKTLLAVVMLE